MLDLVDGWTDAIDYQLIGDGAAVDLTGLTVTTIAMQVDGTAIVLTGATSVPDPVAGHVRFEPAVGDIQSALGPYHVRWRVVDTSGKQGYYPNGSPEVWKIWRKP